MRTFSLSTPFPIYRKINVLQLQGYGLMAPHCCNWSLPGLGPRMGVPLSSDPDSAPWAARPLTSDLSELRHSGTLFQAPTLNPGSGLQVGHLALLQ